MDNQITMAGFEPPEQKEIAFLESIFQRLKEAVIDQGGEASFLAYKSTKSEKTSSGYTSVSFHKFTAFRLHIRGKKHYISVPIMFVDLIPSSYPKQRIASDPNYHRVLIDDLHPLISYTDLLIKIAGETVNRYPKEFDCCSRYMECSDAKTCIHPDKAVALVCGYRKILHSGRIFYGKNRNID